MRECRPLGRGTRWAPPGCPWRRAGRWPVCRACTGTAGTAIAGPTAASLKGETITKQGRLSTFFYAISSQSVILCLEIEKEEGSFSNSYQL